MIQFENPDQAYNALVEEGLSKNMTKRDIALRTGIFPQALSNNLREGNIKFKTLKDLAEVMGYNISLILKPKANESSNS